MHSSLARSNDDSEIIELCRKMVAVCRQEYAICRASADEFEPDIPVALTAEERRLGRAIAKASRPTTPEGIKALAEVALEFSTHAYDGGLVAPLGFDDWVTSAALLAAAGSRERLPPPK